MLSKSIEEHKSHLDKVFEAIHKAGLTINMDKTSAFDLLGFKIDLDEVCPIKRKIDNLRDMGLTTRFTAWKDLYNTWPSITGLFRTYHC